MSGGVDSSVAAHLLKEQGHEVIGVFMRHGHQSPVACSEPPSQANSAAGGASGETHGTSLPIINRLDHKQGCCTAADAADARRVADRLGIPFYALNLEAEFGRIIDYFVDEYAAGRTPNPCVQCNNWIKFGKLFDYADSVGAEYVATGHYARLEPTFSGIPALLRGRDSAKDQSYVLFGIDKKYLSRMLLPVGDFEKPEIRRLAAELGFNVAEKRDSQEICFVTQGHYSDFVKAHLSGESQSPINPVAGGRSGEFVLTSGEVVGTHDGIEGFTVGQRKGLGIALGEPKFVIRIEPDTNRVVLGDRAELAQASLTAAATNWLVPTEDIPRKCEVQIRYNTRPVAASVEILPGKRILVEFDEPQCGVAPGQAVVVYDGMRTLGGGWIESY